MLSLFKCFKVLKDSPLPDPKGSLSDVIDPWAIEAANEEVKSVLKIHKCKGEVKAKCSPYIKVTPTQKANMLRKMGLLMQFDIFKGIFLRTS